jgi:hypothetical protein
MTKKNNVSKEIRVGVRAFADLCSDLGATCAAINTHLDEEIEVVEGVKLSVRKWLDLIGVDMAKTAKGLTPKVVKAVWNKEMMQDSNMCVWKRVIAKVGDKNVYKYDLTKKDFVAVGEYHLIKVEKWTVRLLLQALYDGWNYEGVRNKMRDNTAKLKTISKFYVTESKTATRKSVKSAMVEVKREDIQW